MNPGTLRLMLVGLVAALVMAVCLATLTGQAGSMTP